MSTEDLLAVRALVDRYSDAANRCDPADMAATYAEDAELVVLGQPPIRGRETIRQVFAGTIGQMEFMNQVCSGGVIELDGDRASARWTVTEFAKRRNKDKLDLFLGTYEDEMVRKADGWQFSRRTLSQRAKARFEAMLKP